MRTDGRNLSLTFGPIEVACVSTSVVLDVERADADRVTFDDVVNGKDRTWFFTIRALSDFASGSFWELLWSTPAFTPISYLFRPYGNTTPTTQQPIFSGKVTIDDAPPVGGDAGKLWDFTTRLTCTARPTRVTAPNPPP